jgi:hypothetical protein
MHITKAAGFTAGDCDVITTFDVMVEYEQRQNRPNVREAIEVTIAGKTYEGRLRNIGVYPLGLNLACVDFPEFAPRERPTVYPLALETVVPSAVTYDEELSQYKPGTPFLDKKDRVVAMLAVFDPTAPEFVSAAQLRQFLREAENVPRSKPHLSYRPLQ